jgi:copper chaperone CopZ
MKTKIAVLFVALIMSGANLFAAEKHVQVVVKGLVCSLCSQKLETNFKKLPEVKEVKVQFEAENPVTKKKENIVHLTFVEDKTLSKEQIEKLIVDSGYNVKSIEGL